MSPTRLRCVLRTVGHRLRFRPTHGVGYWKRACAQDGYDDGVSISLSPMFSGILSASWRPGDPFVRWGSPPRGPRPESPPRALRDRLSPAYRD